MSWFELTSAFAVGMMIAGVAGDLIGATIQWGIARTMAKSAEKSEQERYEHLMKRIKEKADALVDIDKVATHYGSKEVYQQTGEEVK